MAPANSTFAGDRACVASYHVIVPKPMPTIG
jgi:hypothetical protein